MRGATYHLPALIVLAVTISACVSRPTLTLPPLDSWETRERVLRGVSEWRARGRIGLVFGEEAESGSLDWRQEKESVLVSIRGPLGAGGLTLQGDGHVLRLTGSDGETLVLSHPEEQLREIYGWTIPVDSLSYWLLGIPDPGRVADTRVSPEGWLEQLKQAGWDIAYGEYRPAAGVMLPYRVKARSGDIRLTILLKDWQFGPDTAL